MPATESRDSKQEWPPPDVGGYKKEWGAQPTVVSQPCRSAGANLFCVFAYYKYVGPNGPKPVHKSVAVREHAEEHELASLFY